MSNYSCQRWLSVRHSETDGHASLDSPPADGPPPTPRSVVLPLYKYGASEAEKGIASSSTTTNPESRAMVLAKAKEIVASAPVVVFSKTYCSYCNRVKQLFTQLGASFKAIELDVESDGSELQSALAEWTGQRTVPNVFINGKRIGGCDDTVKLNNEGNLVPLLTEAGAIASSAAKITSTA